MLAHLLLALTTLPTATPVDDACLVVIVNAENPIIEIEVSVLARMFLKRTRKWDHSVPVLPIDLDDGLPMRQAFTRGVHGKETSAILKYWQRMIFSGRDVPPPTARDDAEVIKHVRDHPGGVGYVTCGSVSVPWAPGPGPGVRPVEVVGLAEVPGLLVEHDLRFSRQPRPVDLLAPLMTTALVVTPTVPLGQDKATRLYLAGRCGGEGEGRWVALENLDAKSRRVVAVEHRILSRSRLRHRAVETHELPPGHIRYLGCSQRGHVEHRFALVEGS
jgi:hypothetical protein